MSDTKDETGTGPDDQEGTASDSTEGAAEVDLEALAEEDGDPEEDGLDLSDLEAHGVDGVIARMSSGGDDEVADALGKAKPHRSPIISMLVVAFGAYLLVTMWADFRYWLHASEPVELGHAASLLEDGRNLDAYENQFVVLEGTPDVQHAARLTTKEKFIGYLRVTEGGGGLFAAIPRSKDEQVTNNFAGRYQGRLRRLGEDRAYQWLAEFYANEKVTLGVDLDPDGMVEALGSGRLPALEGGTVDVEPTDELRLVFEGPDARVQLGKSSFDSPQEAAAAIEALGHPFVQLEETGTFYRFVVRIPEDERGKIQRALNEGLEGVEDNTDPKVGAFVLALPLNFGVPAGEIRVEGDALVFPYGDNTTTPGYTVQGGALVERSAAEVVSMPVGQLRSARFERVIEVDPEGFVVAVGETPAEVLREAVLWLLVLAITMANMVSLLLWWRRRPS